MPPIKSLLCADEHKKDSQETLEARRNYMLAAYKDEIRVRAYIIWLQTGHADALANWHEAEQELLRVHGLL